MRNRRNVAFACKGVAAAITLAFAGHASALDFELGDWQGSWQNTLSIGTSIRAKNPDPKLVGVTGPAVGINNAGFNSVDEGNINYGKGDAFTTLIKWFTEVELKKGTMGVLVRGKAWYDYTLKNDNPKFGHEPNGYSNRTPLNDTQQTPLLKFSGTYLLDAYAYDSFEIAGKPLQIRVGNQVVNWGESVFVQGVNYINPIDVPAYHKPGAQLKEVFLPVPILYANQSLGEYGNVEAFYQWRFVPTPIDMTCGNYWGVAQGNIGTNQGTCQNSANLATENFVPVGPSGLANLQAGMYIPGMRGEDPNDSGNWGLAYHWNMPSLDTEFGVYYEKVRMRTPVVSAQYVPGAGGTIPQLLGGVPGVAAFPGRPGYPQGFSTIAARWDYAEDMKVIGLSAATVIGGWSIAAEISQKRDFHVQIDGNDLLGGCLGGAGPAAALCANSAIGGANAASGLAYGGTKANLTQIQVNGVNAGNGVLGAGQWVAVWEVAAQRNNLPNYHDSPTNLRYNRAFVFGAGGDATNGCPGVGFMGAPPSQPSAGGFTPAMCSNDGYVSKSAWGYRFLGWLTYNDAFMGAAVIPKLFWSHDVKGYSADSQFLQDRQTLGLSVKLDYQKKYALEFGYTTYNKHAQYDALSDRDFYSATFTYNF